MSIRDLVWSELSADPQLNTWGINAGTLFGTFAPDSPAATTPRWAVLRWGVRDAGAGPGAPARPLELNLWVYDTERDYRLIDMILRRAELVLKGLAGRRIGDAQYPGWVGEITGPTSSPDLWDDVYRAITRNETYIIVVSE